MTRFAGRVALITGAGGDIGRATACRLAAEGARIFAVDRDGDALDATVAAVRDAGGDAAGTVADVTVAADAARYARTAATQFGDGAIDAFFNNAGIEGPIAAATELDDDRFDAVIAVNVRGVYLGMKHVIPHMREGSAIVNTGSTGSLFGTPNLAAYVASKHAVLGLTRSVAKEVAEHGIRINAVCPGPVEGRMMSSIEDGLGSGPERHDEFAASVPMRRYAQPDEIAAVVAFLLSADAGYVTGAAYPVDGGQRA